MQRVPNRKVFGTMRVKGKIYKDARRFGELVWILEPRDEVYPDTVDEDAVSACEIINEKLTEFDPDRDFILLSGDPAGIAMIMMCVGRKYKKAKLLKWDNGENRYYEITIKT